MLISGALCRVTEASALRVNGAGVQALTPLTIGRSHVQASMLGALWGFGHSTGQLLLGLLMVLLKDRFEHLVPALSRWGGTTVGLTLIAIGLLGLYEVYGEQPEQQTDLAYSGAHLAFCSHGLEVLMRHGGAVEVARLHRRVPIDVAAPEHRCTQTAQG